MLSVRASTLGVYQKTQSLEAVMSEDTRLQNFQRIFIPCLGLSKIGTLHHISHNLILRLCIRMDALPSLSRLSIGDSVPLGWGWSRHWSLMQARASKSSLLGIHTSNSGPQCPQWPQKEVPRL